MAKFFFLVLFALVAVAFAAIDEEYIREERSAYNGYPPYNGNIVNNGYYPGSGIPPSLVRPYPYQPQQAFYPGGYVPNQNTYYPQNQYQNNHYQHNQYQPHYPIL